MGKVKALWEAEREKRLLELSTAYELQGYAKEEAQMMAYDDMDEEDAANDQFGVGA